MGLIQWAATRESGLIVGEWEIWEGVPEPNRVHWSTLHDRFESCPYSDLIEPIPEPGDLQEYWYEQS